MKNLKIYTLLLVSACIAFSCDEEDKLINDILVENPIPVVEDPMGEPGGLDLSVYVSLGASITAGTKDNALYSHGQATSYPALLAGQFAADGVGGGAFNQPDINSANGYSGVDGTTIQGKYILDLDLNNDGELGDAGVVISDGELPTAYEGDKTMLNNFGVPGIITAQILTPATGGPDVEANPAYNALYARFASAPGTSSIIKDAWDKDPTFFTLWAGGNDVLGYAASGGADPSRPLTDPATVNAQVDMIVDSLLSKAGHGLILTVPNVLVLPYFQAVPRVISVPEDSRTELLAGIQQINAAIAGWNAAVAGSGMERPLLSTDMNEYPLVIEDASLSDASVPDGEGGTFVIPKVRNIDPDAHSVFGVSELITLTASPKVSAGELGISPLAPLTNQYVLDFTEIAAILTNIQTVNTNMGATAVANAGRIAVLETFGLITEIAVSGGYDTGSYTLAPDFSPNGIYSNDGVHPNARGCAIIANEIIKVLNKPVAEGGFGATIPSLDVMQYNASPFQQ